MVTDKTREAVWKPQWVGHSWHFCLQALLPNDVQRARKNLAGKVLFFAFPSSQIFLKELPPRKRMGQHLSSAHSFVIVSTSLRVYEFPIWKGIFGDNGVHTSSQNKLWKKIIYGVYVFLPVVALWRWHLNPIPTCFVWKFTSFYSYIMFYHPLTSPASRFY